MAQHDQDIANQSASALRADLNNALAALFSNSSGASAPTVTVAYQWWIDTTNGQIKQRNAANNGWITWGTIGSTLSISGTNISPNFGSQNVVTTGTASASQFIVDANFFMVLSGGTSPVVQFDALDYFSYDRTNNALNLVIGNTNYYSFRSDIFIATPAYSATTASAANAFINTNGQIMRSTSARKYKGAVEDLPAEESVEIINQLKPITYASLAPDDPTGRRYLGFIADDVLPIDPRLVSVGETGEPEGFEYSRLTAHLVNYCQHLQQRLAALERNPEPSLPTTPPLPPLS
jgi:hypothetical protein